LAVRLDIRPRLTLPPERVVAPLTRRSWRMPPLALPAAGYWLAMGALTYVFAHLGPHPLEPTEVAAAERDTEQPDAPPAFERQAVPETVTNPTPAEPPALTEAAPPPELEPALVVADEREPKHENENENDLRENRKAGRREGFLGSSSEAPEQPVLREPEAPRVAMSFPEFTDSTQPPERERAADGPRIDSLFERAPATERPTKDAAPDAPPPPSNDPDGPAVAASCEAAIARNNEQLVMGAARGAPDISREAYAGILQNGRYLSGCSLPERTVFEICAAVKDGRAIGITVVSTPPNAKLNACVRRAVAHLKFPQNSRMDVTHTRFDAASR
jgi:hypothetical protein